MGQEAQTAAGLSAFTHQVYFLGQGVVGDVRARVEGADEAPPLQTCTTHTETAGL